LLETEQGQDIWFSEERIKLSRNFTNKIWNASRFVISNLHGRNSFRPINEYKLEKVDVWILSMTEKAVELTKKYIDDYDFAKYSGLIYDFFWDDFCDWYIEISKKELYGKDENKKEKVQAVLQHILETFLRIAHPAMPFITEEIYGILHPDEKGFLNKKEWPQTEKNYINDAVENEFSFIKQTVKSIRNLRAEIKIKPSEELDLVFQINDGASKSLLNENESLIKYLSKVKQIDYFSFEGEKPKNALSSRVQDLDIYLPIEGRIDIDKELDRLNKELASSEERLTQINRKLSNISFIKNAPSEVVEKEKEKLNHLNQNLEKIQKRLSLLKGRD